MNTDHRRSLLSSQARVQVPWIKVTLGTYSFGVFSRRGGEKNKEGFYTSYNVQYPNYIQKLDITKINGKVNTYSLSIAYPVTTSDDPNFFEKVFSSVSGTRKIIFSYGDASTPSFFYKEEEAIITKISQTFNIVGSVINYTVSAVSGSVMGLSGSYSFPSDDQLHKPSDIIKKLFLNKSYGLQELFKGMPRDKIDLYIAGDDAAVRIPPKMNISIIDYLTFLTSCMLPSGTTTNTQLSNDIYIFTIHDDTSYDKIYGNSNVCEDVAGPYFRIRRTSYKSEQSDAYNIDIGFNTSTIVTQFSVENNENYSLFYDYQIKNNPAEYIERLNVDGEWENIYAPASTSKGKFDSEANDTTWWTKITKYPVNASITIQGLLRPAMLMSHVRLNVIFPGGHKHIASGLYIVTKQVDSIDGNGYRTQLSLTKISGDNYLKTNPNN